MHNVYRIMLAIENLKANIDNKNNVNRLPPEKYKIPEEYEPDFGFFDGEDDKLKILGR